MAKKTETPEGANRMTYDDLRKLADTSFEGDMKAAVYSLDPKVVTATVDSFGGNIDRTNRPMYIHRDENGRITGYSTTNSGDALDKGVKPEGRFQSVLVPFVRQGKDGPEYTEDYSVAQKWYDESGQHYGKFDMDFTTPEAKIRSICRFNAASLLVHREQQLRYQPEFDKLLKQQAAKAGDAGESKSSSVPSGNNPALDGYSGPRIVINPSTFKNEKDALCVAFDEAFRIVMEMNGFDPQSEPTEKQRKFFSDTEYANDERMLRRTILARICTFDTSVSDPTDEQLQEAVEFLDTVMEIGAPQNEWEQRSVQRIRDAIAKTVGQPRAPEETPEPPAEGPGNAAAGGGETEDEIQVSGSRGNILTYQGRRITDREAGKIRQEQQGGNPPQQNPAANNAQQPAQPQQGQPQQNPAAPGQVQNAGVNNGAALQDANAFTDNNGEMDTEGIGEMSSTMGTETPDRTKFVQSGARGNVYTVDGRRVTQREYERRKALEGA